MEKRKNISLELILDAEHAEYEQTARELVYRELAKQFPITCGCGKIYHTEEQVARETEPCGAADYGNLGLFQFHVNCDCKSTKSLELGKGNFNTFEIYGIQKAMQTLGEEALKVLVKHKENKEDLKETDCGKYVRQYIKYQKTANAILTNPEEFLKDEETQIYLGINIFRDRYLDWIKKRAKN